MAYLYSLLLLLAYAVVFCQLSIGSEHPNNYTSEEKSRIHNVHYMFRESKPSESVASQLGFFPRYSHVSESHSATTETCIVHWHFFSESFNPTTTGVVNVVVAFMHVFFASTVYFVFHRDVSLQHREHENQAGCPKTMWKLRDVLTLPFTVPFLSYRPYTHVERKCGSLSQLIDTEQQCPQASEICAFPGDISGDIVKCGRQRSSFIPWTVYFFSVCIVSIIRIFVVIPLQAYPRGGETNFRSLRNATEVSWSIGFRLLLISEATSYCVLACVLYLEHQHISSGPPVKFREPLIRSALFFLLFLYICCSVSPNSSPVSTTLSLSLFLLLRLSCIYLTASMVMKEDVFLRYQDSKNPSNCAALVLASGVSVVELLPANVVHSVIKRGCLMTGVLAGTDVVCIMHVISVALLFWHVRHEYLCTIDVGMITSIERIHETFAFADLDF